MLSDQFNIKKCSQIINLVYTEQIFCFVLKFNDITYRRKLWESQELWTEGLLSGLYR